MQPGERRCSRLRARDDGAWDAVRAGRWAGRDPRRSLDAGAARARRRNETQGEPIPLGRGNVVPFWRRQMWATSIAALLVLGLFSYAVYTAFMNQVVATYTTAQVGEHEALSCAARVETELQMQGVADPPPGVRVRGVGHSTGKQPVAAGVGSRRGGHSPLPERRPGLDDRGLLERGPTRRTSADHSTSFGRGRRVTHPGRPLPSWPTWRCCDAHHRQAIRLAYRLRDLGDAEEAVQEVFLSAWRSGHTYDPSRGTTHTWILSMVRNRCVDVPARPQTTSRQQMAEGLDPPDSSDVPTEAVSNVDAAAARLRSGAAARTEASDRAGLLRGPVAQRNRRAAAAPIGTVKGRIRLGLDRLRVSMGVQLDPLSAS